MGFVNGHTYYMEVSLRMGIDHISCEGPRDAGCGGGGALARDTIGAPSRGQAPRTIEAEQSRASAGILRCLNVVPRYYE